MILQKMFRRQFHFMILKILLIVCLINVCYGIERGEIRCEVEKRSTSAPQIFKSKSYTLDDVYCVKAKCPDNSFCYLGSCQCHPGYDKATLCRSKLAVANPWFTAYCPNLQSDKTYSSDTPLESLGGEYFMLRSPDRDVSISALARFCGTLKACAYLCYSHPSYGTAVVPAALWRQAQGAEAALWSSIGGTMADDRAKEHWEAFAKFGVLVSEKRTNLGHVLEVGAGPWTQLKAIMFIRPELRVSRFTIWEPSASHYMATVPTCSYRYRDRLMRWNERGASDKHSFPIEVVSRGGEDLPFFSSNRTIGLLAPQYDTVVSINVLEHVRNAFAYLTNLYLALKPGGTLIFHERFYDDQGILNGDRFHPIRIKRIVLDQFLKGFDVLFNNCSAKYDGRPFEKGYYVIARKR